MIEHGLKLVEMRDILAGMPRTVTVHLFSPGHVSFKLVLVISQ